MSSNRRSKELCRNFLRGSCHYGDRCKFVHATQQQPKPNPFGFGAQSASQPQRFNQQPKSNPFGFGVQNIPQSQSPVSFGYGAQIVTQPQSFTQQHKTNPFGFGVQLKNASNFGVLHQTVNKPFENKWTRSSNLSSSQQTNSQPLADIHKCTDPESCKRQIVEDFKNESPLWKLTCYGHSKNGPCDIVGDISFEELHAAAYDDARRGLPVQAIVERERNLLNSKLAEFDNLARNPYVPISSCSSQTPSFPGGNSDAPPAPQSGAPPSFSSFGQLGASANVRSDLRTNVPGNAANSMFGQPNPLQSGSQASGGFAMQFGMPGAFGIQNPIPPVIPPSSNTSNITQQPTQSRGNIDNKTNGVSDGPKFTPVTAYTPNAPLDRDVPGPPSVDESIWQKKVWAVGEIPEAEPPERFCTCT